MAVYLNAKGTTNASFQIGKRGNKFFGGVSSPDSSNVVDGDVWLDNANGDFKIASVSNGTVTWSSIVASGDSFSANDLTVTGNLTVNGTQTVINTTTLDVEDNIITLNSNFTGADNVVDAGIEVNRGEETNVSFLWDEAEGEWTLGAETLVAGGFIGDLHGNVIGSLRPNGQPNSVIANVLTAGNATISNIAYPTADGTANQVLTTDGSGTLSFTTVNTNPDGSNTQVQFNNADSFGASTGFTFDDSGDILSTGIIKSISFEQLTDYDVIADSSNIASDLGSITSNVGAKIDQGLVVTDYGYPILPSVNVANLPSGQTAGTFLFCPNESGGATIVFYDGTNWRRSSDNGIVS
jgi:hypothetical protein